MLDGRISEDSAVDLGDVITDEDEIIEELIKRGMCITYSIPGNNSKSWNICTLCTK